MRKKRPAWEYVVVALVISSSMLLSIALYAKRDQVFKERVLIWELSRLRNEVTAYMLEHRARPDGLGLWTMDYGPWTKNKEGVPLDPFGNPYRYDPKSGWVSSMTPGFTKW